MTFTTAGLAPLIGDAARVYKLCKSRDPETALEGLKLATTLSLGPLPGILDGVQVGREGTIVRGPRFTGRASAQPMLDALLIQQLGRALPGSPEQRLCDQIISLELELPIIPHLAPFSNLKTAKIILAPELQADNLLPIGRTLALKSLTITGGPSSFLRSLTGLDAPNLEILKAKGLRLEDIDALRGSQRLRVIDLSSNDFVSIESLSESAQTLEELDISRCSRLNSTEVLKKAPRLKWADVAYCSSLTSVEGLRLRTWGEPSDQCAELKGLVELANLDGLRASATTITRLRLDGLPALTSLRAPPEILKPLRALELFEVGVANLDGLESLLDVQELVVYNCQYLVDARTIGRLEGLRDFSVKQCSRLELLPETWPEKLESLQITECAALQPLKTSPAVLDPRAVQIDDRRIRPKGKTIKGPIGEVWKLLASNDISSIRVGLKRADDLGNASDALTDGVYVLDGRLIRGKRFTGSKTTQPYLDLALLGLMSRARPDSHLSTLRAQINLLEIPLCAQAPELVGFTNLHHLTLSIMSDSTPDLEPFGHLPALTGFFVNSIDDQLGGSLSSLKGLNAPELLTASFARCGLRDLSGLRNSPGLRDLTLWGMDSLSSIDDLVVCAPNLLKLELKSCTALKSISGLKTARHLETLKLAACSELDSIEPLSHLNPALIDLSSCKALKSLHGLASTALTWLTIDGTSIAAPFEGLRSLPSVTHLYANSSDVSDLSGIQALPSLTGLTMRECKRIKDATPLGILTRLDRVDLEGSSVTQLPKKWEAPVTSLVVSSCDSLTSLGQLPATLKSLSLDRSNKVETLDGLEQCTELESISAVGCSSLKSIGTPPSSLKSLSVRGCPNIKSLRGLAGCAAIDRISVPITIEDLSDLEGRSFITVEIDLNELPLETVDGSPRRLPDALIMALNGLQTIRLEIIGSWGVFDRDNRLTRLFDLSNLTLLERANSLSFDTGRQRYDSAIKVKALQRQICEMNGLERPEHLI